MPVADPHGDLALVRAACAEAGRIAMRYFGKSPEVWMKDGASPVSEADYAADKYLRETLLAARPSYGWLSEETADSAARLSTERLFIADPIDGTRGFLEGNRRWCVSVAVVERGAPVAGVLECPALGEQFIAVPGQGAWLNGKRLSVRQPGERLEIGGPKPFFDHLPDAIRQKTERISYVPSLAYRLALIAAGRMDATFVKPNAHDWDIAAADLILREAGGALLGANGQPPVYGGENTAHGALIAGHGQLLDAMLPIISPDGG